MIKKFDNLAQMYVYESIIVVLMIIAAIGFIAASSPQPTISHSSKLFQLETLGNDALRLADEQGILKNTVINAYSSGEQISASNDLIVYLDEAIIDTLIGVDYSIKINGMTFYGNAESAASTATTHRIVAQSDGVLYDVQLLMWYKGL